MGASGMSSDGKFCLFGQGRAGQGNEVM